MSDGKISLYAVFAALLIMIGFFFIPTPKSDAFFAPPTFSKPFGGRIQCSVVCTCSGAIGIKVGSPKGGDFLFYPGASQLFPNRNIVTPMTWVLGLAIPNVKPKCQIYVGTGCQDAPCVSSGNIIMMIGTS